MIDFFHVYKTYRENRVALRDINLQIGKGEFLFLTGHSGAGKSTLFRLISGFDRATSGTVKVAGYNLVDLGANGLSQLRRQIGVVFQDFKLLKDQSIFDNVALPLRIMGERPKSVEKAVKNILSQVGLRHKEAEWPEYLSGGEQQRVAIARALVHKPGILVADEPTGNLDPALSLEILDLFETANSQGTTVILATHDQTLVQRKCRRTIRLDAGHIQEDSGVENRKLSKEL